MSSSLKVLLLDNYDSFTYNLYDYIAQLGHELVVFRNDEISMERIKQLKLDAIVLSPGPGKPKDAGITMKLIETFHNEIPILGICLGHQAIGEYFGAKLVKAKNPMHGITTFIHYDKAIPIYAGLKAPIEVMRYHSLILEGVELPLEVTSKTDLNEIMSIQHNTLPITGIQFHPESILTKDGMQIMKNWFEKEALKFIQH